MRRPLSRRLRVATADQLFNAERLLIDGSLTLFSSSSYVGGSQPAASGELHPRPAVAPPGLHRSKPPRHPLILDGFFPTSRPSRRKTRAAGNCACTFYLVFKEPAFPRFPHPASISPSGEPYEITPALQPCQDLFARPDQCRRLDSRKGFESRKGLAHLKGDDRKGTAWRTTRAGAAAGTQSVHPIYVSRTRLSTTRRPRLQRPAELDERDQR